MKSLLNLSFIILHPNCMRTWEHAWEHERPKLSITLISTRGGEINPFCIVTDYFNVLFPFTHDLVTCAFKTKPECTGRYFLVGLHNLSHLNQFSHAVPVSHHRVASCTVNYLNVLFWGCSYMLFHTVDSVSNSEARFPSQHSSYFKYNSLHRSYMKIQGCTHIIVSGGACTCSSSSSSSMRLISC